MYLIRRSVEGDWRLVLMEKQLFQLVSRAVEERRRLTVAGNQLSDCGHFDGVQLATEAMHRSLMSRLLHAQIFWTCTNTSSFGLWRSAPCRVDRRLTENLVPTLPKKSVRRRHILSIDKLTQLN